LLLCYFQLYGILARLILTELRYTTLHYTTLHYTTLHYATIHDTALPHYTTRRYTTLRYTTLHAFHHSFVRQCADSLSHFCGGCRVCHCDARGAEGRLLTPQRARRTETQTNNKHKWDGGREKLRQIETEIEIER
jgi:hypothetical protein